MTTQYNVVTYGDLINTNGVLSGFSGSNYATIPLNFNPVQRPFEVVFKFAGTNGVIWNVGDLTTPRGHIEFEIYQSKLYAEASANTTLIWSIDGVTTLSPNTNYWVKLAYNGVDTYSLYLSTDGTTWNTEGTVTSSAFLADGSTEYNLIGVQAENGGVITYPFDGSINLNESYINIDNIRWWQGVTSTSNVQTRIQLRHDTAANWTSVNPILLEGEVGIETDTLKQKVGDGSTAWNSLSYMGSSEIFIAEYNVTSWNDIVSAYNSGKTIICKYLQEGNSSDIYNYPQYSLGCLMNVRKNTGGLVSITFYFELCSISVNSTNWSKSSKSILREAVQNNTEYISPYSQYFGVLSTDDYTTVYNLIDTTTGLIPDARISSNIARTSAIPDISTKQDTLVSGTNIKTVNNTSLLGSGNIDTSQIFFAVYGTTTTTQINQALSNGKTIICTNSTPSVDKIYYYSGTATIGGLSAFTFSRVYQNTTEVVYVSSSTNVWNTITKTLANDDLSNVSSIDSGSAVQTALDAKVNKSGDTMTGDLSLSYGNPVIMLKNENITKGTNPSEDKYTTLEFCDGTGSTWQTRRLGYVQHILMADGTSKLAVGATKNVASSTDNSNIVLQETSAGVATCSFPNTTCVDGQWIASYQEAIGSATQTISGQTTKDITFSNLPAKNCEVIFTVSQSTDYELGIYSSLISGGTLNRAMKKGVATFIMPVSSDKKVKIYNINSNTASINFVRMFGYRILGTNATP